MARQTAEYVCQSCGAAHGQWAGRCGACGEWNSLVEEAKAGATHKGALGSVSAKGKARKMELTSLNAERKDLVRLVSGMTESHERALKHPVTVAPTPQLSGALGAALLAAAVK